MKDTRKKSLVSKLGLLSVTLIWGSSFVVVKNATASVPPSWIIFFRFGLTALLLCIFFFPRLKTITRREVRGGFAIAFWTALGYELQTYGVKYTTAGNNAFLTAVYCVIVPFLFWFFRHVRPNRYQIFSAFLCIAGVGLLSLHGSLSMNAGDLLSLLCGFSFAMQIIAIDKYAAGCDPMMTVMLQSAFTAALVLPAALLFERVPALPGTDTLLSLLYLSVLGTLTTNVVQFACQKNVEPSSASLIMSLESVFGTLAGVIFLHEPITFRSFFGCVLIFGAVCISELSTGWVRGKKGPAGGVQV